MFAISPSALIIISLFQVNVDNCRVVIEQQRARAPSIRWEVGDVTNMKDLFCDDEFDVVLDKSLIDTMMCYNVRSIIKSTVVHASCIFPLVN